MSCGANETMNAYDVGDIVVLTNQFTEGGSPVDPPTVICKVQSPFGVETTYTYNTNANLVRTGAGAYECHVEPNAAGTWRYRWEGGDPAAVQLAKRGAEEGRFLIRQKAFA